MAKQKIKTINGKRLVVGNVNELTNNEVLIEQKGDSISLKERVNGEIKELSGNSGGASGSESGYVYLNTEKITSYSQYRTLNQYAILVKYSTTTTRVITHEFYANKTEAICLDFNGTINVNGIITTVYDVLVGELGKDFLDSIPRITKEEFYDLQPIIEDLVEGQLLYYSNFKAKKLYPCRNQIQEVFVVNGWEWSNDEEDWQDSEIRKYIDITEDMWDGNYVVTPKYKFDSGGGFIFKVGSDLKSLESLVYVDTYTRRTTKDAYNELRYD